MKNFVCFQELLVPLLDTMDVGMRSKEMKEEGDKARGIFYKLTRVRKVTNMHYTFKGSICFGTKYTNLS